MFSWEGDSLLCTWWINGSLDWCSLGTEAVPSLSCVLVAPQNTWQTKRWTLNEYLLLGEGGQTCNPSSSGVEAGWWQLWGQLWGKYLQHPMWKIK
jgi:hypothetical protein